RRVVFRSRRGKSSLVVEFAVALMGNNRRAFRNIGPESTRVIEVVVCVHQVANRLVGDELLHFSDHGERTLLVQGRLDHRYEIAELESHAVVTSPRNEAGTGR